MANSNKFEYFPFYPGRWLNDDDVISMTEKERGQYIELLCISWINNGLTKTVLDRKTSSMLVKKKFIYNGRSKKYRNKFQEEIRKRVKQEVFSKSEGGRKGANKRWDSYRSAIGEPSDTNRDSQGNINLNLNKKGVKKNARGRTRESRPKSISEINDIEMQKAIAADRAKREKEGSDE